MPNPWDRPAFPKRGHRSTLALYVSIGRALNFWEMLEVTLAHLYAALSERDAFDEGANHAYGRPANFRERLANLEAVGCRYFRKHPHQDLEGELSWVIRYAAGYSQRRNDIAHGIVRLAALEGIDTADMRFWVVPPHFRGDKFTPGNMPAYIFTSREINHFARTFEMIVVRAWSLAAAVELPQRA